MTGIKSYPQAVIFDMDGTLMDNNPYHLLAWKEFCREAGRELSDTEYRQHISGRVNRDILSYLSGKNLPEGNWQEGADRKEQLYRTLYLPHMTPLNGLMLFLSELAEAGIKTGIATSAQPVNIKFAMDQLSLYPFFTVIVDSTGVKRGKPDPEIFLATSRLLGEKPADCLVFEDSLSGIRGARAAGMRAIGLTTTHTSGELILSGADFCFPDYEGLSLSFLQKLFLIPGTGS